MATAAPSTYNVPAGKKVVAGRVRYPNALLDLVAAAPSLSWVKANLNRIDAVFPIPDLSPPFGAGPSNARAVINCWSSFGWDPNRSRLAIFGGGHANASSNELFIFDCMTRMWRLGFVSNDVVLLTGVAASDGYRAPGGHLTAPISAHTYGNNNYLPIADRFITFGGSKHSSGGPWQMVNAAGVVRSLTPGGYTCDLGLEGQGFVGARTGDNVHRNTTIGVDLPGANAWKVRDYQLDHAQAALTAGMTTGRSGGTVITKEGGVDVIYRMCGGDGATSLSLFRIAYPNIQDYKQDQISQVGSSWSNIGGDGSSALDTGNNIFVYIGQSPDQFVFWDLKVAAPSQVHGVVKTAGLVGTGATSFVSTSRVEAGLIYDPKRARFVIWDDGGTVYSLIVPPNNPPPVRDANASVIPATGWAITVLADPPTVRPATNAEQPLGNVMTGVHGKWRYAPELDLYVGLQGAGSGDVWVFKPENWIDPRT